MMTPCSLTVFTSVFDNETKRRMNFESFAGLEKLLYALAKKPGYKPRKDVRIPKGVTPSPLISPALYTEGKTRSNKNVESWSGWCCIDVDDYDSSFEEAVDLFRDFYFVCYSTASSTIEHPKFRIVFPLTRSVPAEKIQHFWFAVNAQFKNTVDAQTKDLSRMFYIPAEYPEANNFIFTHRSENIMDPDAIMSQHPYIKPVTSAIDALPEDVQEKILEYTRSKLKNVSYKWTSYKDCVFVHPNAIRDYMGLTGGWYNKSFKLMCGIACSAVKRGYPITAAEIATLFREIDLDNGNWYSNRPIEGEAARALAFALKSVAQI